MSRFASWMTAKSLPLCALSKFTTRMQHLGKHQLLLLLLFLAGAPFVCAQQTSSPQLELSRTVRTWEFLPAVGERAGLFGNESGRLEAWVYPLKILRDFHLVFHVEGRALPAETLARTVAVRASSAVITYASDAFQVIETISVPRNEPGAVISMQVSTVQPFEVEAVFRRDFQLEWPAGLGGTYVNWRPEIRAFYFGEEQKKYVAIVGSPTGVLGNEEYATNYSSSPDSSILLGVTQKGVETKVLVIAASLNGPEAAVQTYERLSSTYSDVLKQSDDSYQKYLAETLSLDIPDLRLQQAYDWARVSVIQGLVTNPFLGTGLVAGYRTSGESQRPGFAWYFGRDSLWTALALDAEGDFSTTRTALQFVSKYQRQDGKIPHEISQGASFVDWFKDYPYGYASADATPLYIITTNDYVTHSGDVAFAREKWDSLWKAYTFLTSTYDTQGLPQNFHIGHGWIEGGPLLPVKTELYQSGLGAQALLSLSNLAHLVGREDVSRQLQQEFTRHQALVNDAFWSSARNFFSFALDTNNARVEVPTVLSTVPMWFHLLDEARTQSTIDVLADSDHQADWGMRIISSRDPRYNPGGYHFGSVWPLFTGWASVGEYRYHRSLPAFSNFAANALLGQDGSLGHVTEVLSGDFYESLSTSSPHQIWSAAMVISPLLRGLLGLDVDALSHQVRLEPHLPYDWPYVRVNNVHVADCVLDLAETREPESLTLEIARRNAGQCEMTFSPSLSLRASVHSVELNGRREHFNIAKNTQDQHVTVRFAVPDGRSKLRIEVRNDFGLYVAPSLPPLGERSGGLRIVQESWSASQDVLTLNLAGVSGRTYELGVWKPDQISSVDGAALTASADGRGKLQVKFGGGPPNDYSHSKVTLHFKAR
jgi:glycogen debranching enzyme